MTTKDKKTTTIRKILEHLNGIFNGFISVFFITKYIYTYSNYSKWKKKNEKQMMKKRMKELLLELCENTFIQYPQQHKKNLRTMTTENPNVHLFEKKN